MDSLNSSKILTSYEYKGVLATVPSKTNTKDFTDVDPLQNDKLQPIADKAIQAVSKEQILTLCKLILAEIGKSLKPEVRLEFFASQIAKLESLIKKIEAAERIRIPEVKDALIEILAEEVHYSSRNDKIEKDKTYKDFNEFYSWKMDLQTRILWDKVHPLSYLELPSNLLPDSWHDLLRLSREKYFRIYLSKIESFRDILLDHHSFDAVIVSLATRCENYGCFDFIDKTLLNKISNENARFRFEFDYRLRRKDFKRALDCAYNVPEGQTAACFSLNEDRQHFIEEVLWIVVKEKNGILLALDLILTLPNREQVSDHLDDALREIKSNCITSRYVALNKLLFYVCQTRGLGKAIELLKAIPFPKDQAILVNNLIFRLTQKEEYVSRWDICFQRLFKSDEKARDSEELWKTHVSDQNLLFKAFERLEDKYSLKKEDLQEDIERAIEVFNHFPIKEFTKWKVQEEILTSLRSMYIIEASLRKKDLTTAKKFLPSFRGDKTGLDRYVYRYEELLREVKSTSIYRTVSQFEENQR